MKTAGKNAMIPEARLSKQIATNDDVMAIAEEVEAQTDEQNVEKAAENAADSPALILRGNEEPSSGDDVMTSRRAVEEQAEGGRVDKVVFEDGVNSSAAEEYIHRGHIHD
jgi:hypothetical protein